MVASSAGSLARHSSDFRISADTLKPNLSLSRLAWRNPARSTLVPLSYDLPLPGPHAAMVLSRSRESDRKPDSRVIWVPGLLIGDLVMMLRTPLAALGPYSAAPGPSTNSTRSTSSLVVGAKAATLTRSDGTAANRLSEMTSMAPEKMLLNPRPTTLLCTRPPWEMSTPGRDLRWSITVRAGRSVMSTVGTTWTEAGDSRAFSGARDPVTTTGSSSKGFATSAASAVAVPPAVTTTLSTRTAVNPTAVTSTE